MAINILDNMVINRISAGEVVESPFSIVKELLDNSLDAGATKISVSIRNGGIDQIIVKDNGKGIEKDDIKKAFLPHATSKIKNIEDLDEILTLGFRGEALASISNVSQTYLYTKTADNDCAYSIEVIGGKFSEVYPNELESGTTIEVNNLFFNTPARRKFLRKPKQEEAQITNIISRYILAHPEISFKYVVDDKTIFQTTGKSLIDAISCVYGTETVQNIMPIEKDIGNMKLTGYVSKIGFSKPNTTYQTLMINSRYVVDEIVSKAVYMSFEEYLMPRQFPFYVLNLTMPASEVDANVHPSKINVKFSRPSDIYNLVYSAVRSAIYKAISPKEEQLEKPIVQNNSILINTDISSLQEIDISPNTISKPVDRNLVLKQETYSPITIFDIKTNENKNNEILTINHQQNLVESKSTSTPNYENDYISVDKLPSFKIVGQLFNEFIILEKNDTMFLLDFHAGHERLNYDKFSAMVEKRNIIIQNLLIPYTQQMTENEVQYILSLKTSLNEIGFDLEQFGENSIIISSIPMQLKDINLKAFVDDLLHDIKNIKPTLNNEVKHYLMQKACKSSVKSGMILTEMEINDLLKNIDEKHPVLLCPHGRPIITAISKTQIEKWFKRIV